MRPGTGGGVDVERWLLFVVAMPDFASFYPFMYSRPTRTRRDQHSCDSWLCMSANYTAVVYTVNRNVFKLVAHERGTEQCFCCKVHSSSSVDEEWSIGLPCSFFFLRTCVYECELGLCGKLYFKGTFDETSLDTT